MNLHDAKRLTIEHMGRYPECNGWVFNWHTSKKVFGRVDYRKRKLTLSKVLVSLNGEAVVLNTILHEIAHILTPFERHGYVWKRVARSIGCDGKTRYTTDTVVVPPKKWEGTCPVCGKITYKHRRVRLSCSKCCARFNYGHFSDDYILLYRLNPLYHA